VEYGQTPANNQENTGDQLRQVDDTYIYNSASGLYEPKTHARQDQVDRKIPGAFKKHPLFFSTNRDWIVVGVSVLGLLVSGLTIYLLFRTVHYTRLQWQEANRTANAAICASRTAQESLLTAQRQLVIDQRAWLKFSDDPATQFLKGQPISIPIHVTNIGKTPAEHLWWAIYTSFVPSGEEPDLPGKHIVPGDSIYKLDRSSARQTHILHEEYERSLLYPADHDDATATRLERVRENGAFRVQPAPLLSPEWESFATGKSYIVVFGEVWYLDIFGVTHWTSFCVSKTATGGNTSRKCVEYGKVDNNTE